MKNVITAGIRFYRKWVSPGLPASCRFYPTCSAYSMEAIRRHGALKGSALTARRLLKCHPWHSGGFDPVPGVGERESSGREHPAREFLPDSACCDKRAVMLTAPRSPGPLKR